MSKMLTIKENLKEIIEDGQTSLFSIEKMLDGDGKDTDEIITDLAILSCIEALVDRLS